MQNNRVLHAFFYMNILFYSPHPTHDIVTEVGYATHQRETILALRQLGAAVSPLVMGGVSLEQLPYKEGKAVEHKGFKKILKQLLPGFVWVSIKDFMLLRHDARAGRQLEAAVRAERPDLIYERSEYLQDSAVSVVKRHNIKYFIEVNAPFVQEMKQMEGFSIWLPLGHYREKRKYRAADRIFTVSNVLKDFLCRRYGIEASKILVSPNRINLQAFSGTKHPVTIPGFAANDTETLIGFVGSILPHHNVELLIRAMEIVSGRGKKARLLIVGGGSLLEDLRTLCRNKGLDNLIHFTGKVPHNAVPGLINTMDICVMPGSNWYGSPIKIFEYAALGKAIVAPDNGPLRDVMEHEKDGLLVKEDAESIAGALIRLIDSESLRKELGAHFKSKVESLYTWDKAAAMILKEAEGI